MECGFPLPLPDSQRDSLVYAAKDHAFAAGIFVRMRDTIESQESVTYPPHTLLPSPVPAHCFQAARAVQKDFNLLMHKVAHHYSFMKDCLKETIKVDEFTRQVWQIYETVRQEGLSQPLSLALNRSDYMFDCSRDGDDKCVDPNDVFIKQVEFNTMASSFGGLCDRLSKHHRYMMTETGWDINETKLPDNGALDGLAEGMLFAWKHYNNPSAVILFVILGDEWNIYDQRWLEYMVKQQNPKVKVIRRTLQSLQGHASLGDNNVYVLDGMEVAVIYFRVTYAPSHFHGPEDWSMRLMMERSRAIKCPSAHYFLAGTKKVQQMLAVPGVLERFLLNDTEAVARIRATFAGQFSLDVGSEGDKAVAMALNDPDRFVVKPQREGGGNNIFGEDIRKLLRSLGNSEERNAYILMERIHPAPLRNYVLRPGQLVRLESLVSELGIFGVIVGSETEVLLNKEQGHILRTKTIQQDEGGVAAGFAALDSPYLI